MKKTLCLATLLLLLNSNCLANNYEEKFDVDFAPGTPLVEAIQALGYRAEKDVVINGELKGSVALSLTNTNFYSALDFLAATNGFNYTINGNVILISPATTMSNLRTFRVNFLDLEQLKNQLKLFVPAEKISVNSDASTVTIDGSAFQIAKVAEHLRQYDVAAAQITVKATVIELSKGKARDMGLEFTSDPYLKGNQGINWAIVGKHEERLAQGSILARPSITVFNGRKATILMGDKVPVFTSSSTSSTTDVDTTVNVEYKEVGVKLEVLPRVNEMDNETITMVIKPSISTITKWVESGNNKAPQISSREAETILRVKSGETILLGGLLKDEEIKNIKAIPFLSKLPILGELFKSRSIEKTQTEILIAITPTIVKDINGVPQVQLQESSENLHNKLTSLKQAQQYAESKAEELANLKKSLEETNNENISIEKELEEKIQVTTAAQKKYEQVLKELEETKKVMEKYVKALAETGES